MVNEHINGMILGNGHFGGAARYPEWIEKAEVGCLIVMLGESSSELHHVMRMLNYVCIWVETHRLAG